MGEENEQTRKQKKMKSKWVFLVFGFFEYRRQTHECGRAVVAVARVRKRVLTDYHVSGWNLSLWNWYSGFNDTCNTEKWDNWKSFEFFENEKLKQFENEEMNWSKLNKCMDWNSVV